MLRTRGILPESPLSASEDFLHKGKRGCIVVLCVITSWLRVRSAHTSVLPSPVLWIEEPGPLGEGMTSHVPEMLPTPLTKCQLSLFKGSPGTIPVDVKERDPGSTALRKGDEDFKV